MSPKKIYIENKNFYKGAIVLSTYYRDISSEKVLLNSKVRIARFAHGKMDYHKVLRKKAKILLTEIKKKNPEFEGRVCVDSVPIPEKILARKAGLGWIGKNTNLINPELGSYFFLSVILTNQIFNDTTTPILDHCKNCNLCIKACPTGALSNTRPFGIDAFKCISYLNIEHNRKDEDNIIKTETLENDNSNKKNLEINSYHNWAFGCDICQEVCPYNRSKKNRGNSTIIEEFKIENRIIDLMKELELPENINWEEWSKNLSLSRVSLKKMQININNAKKL